MAKISKQIIKSNLLETIKFIDDALRKYGLVNMTEQQSRRFAKHVKEELNNGDNFKQ